MQASAQDLSLILGNLLQGPGAAIAAAGQLQPIAGQGEITGSEFFATLEDSLQALLDGQQSPLVAFDPAQLQAMLERSLGGQPQPGGGNGLPLENLLAANGDNGPAPALDELLARLRLELTESPIAAAASPLAPQAQLSAASLNPAVVSPDVASDAQLLADQRRLTERLRAMPELQQFVSGDSADEPEVVMPLQKHQATPQPLPQMGAGQGSLDPDLGLKPVMPGEIFAQQMAQLAEQDIVMTAREGAAIDTVSISDMPELSLLSTAGVQRQAPTAVINDARPVSSFIHLPIHDPQWQSEFGNRVTWLAKSGGTQTAEIRLNPANMGPIEVRVVMKDDQATITFTAQHGVVRDAIEASLPRLREMFMGSGLQLANAQVSEHSLQEQRQRHQQGFGSGNGRAKSWYGQGEEFDNLISPIAFSPTQGASLIDRLDLYA